VHGGGLLGFLSPPSNADIVSGEAMFSDGGNSSPQEQDSLLASANPSHLESISGLSASGGRNNSIVGIEMEPEQEQAAESGPNNQPSDPAAVAARAQAMAR